MSTDQAKQQDNFEKLREALEHLTDDVASASQEEVVFYVGDTRFEISYDCHQDILHVEITEQC